jgi:hypothetical protein
VPTGITSGGPTKTTLTFIIPVRHQANAKDWARLKQKLAETMRSIAQQDGGGWRAVVVANQGADLPELPDGFEVKWVDFPPNQISLQNAADKDQFYEALRRDKGRRVLAGMLHAGDTGYLMVVDDDDFVSRRLASFVAANVGANGWFVRDGYIWKEGGRLLFRPTDFSRICGSSHIVRTDLYRLPASVETADDAYVQRVLGSHIFTYDYFAEAGTPLAPLPFVGAVYRIAHAESATSSGGIIGNYVKKNSVWFLIKRFVRQVLRLQLKTRRVEQEFFGRSA